MSIHISNLGLFAHTAAPYADLEGFVPEPGDSPDAFEWPADSFLATASPAEWEAYTQLCKAAINHANARVRFWRETGIIR